MSIINLSNIHKVIEKGEFSMMFVAKEGNIVSADRCICTSFHSAGRTLNIKFIPSGQIRTVRRCTIINYNGQEVSL